MVASRTKYETKGRAPNVLSRIKSFITKKPLSNDTTAIVPIYAGNHSIDTTIQPDKYKQLVNYIKTSGELLSIIDAMVTDILSDGYKFVGDESKIKLAEKFFDENNLDIQLYKWVTDAFIYGNGFAVVNFITETEIKSLIGSHVGEYETKSINDTYYELKEYADEVAKKNLMVQVIPASTVSIYSEDKFGESIKYKQTVGLDSVTFDASEIIHIKDIDLDGQLFGYSRIYSIISELQTLAFTKDYFGLFFSNNATPDKIFIAENMVYGSDEYKDFVRQLADFKNPKNKRKILLALNKIEVKDLNNDAGAKSFSDLIKDFVALIAMTYQMPPSRLGGSAKTTAEEATLSNQGYYRNISSWQDKIEKIWNRQVFKPVFGVEIRFNRNYREDELREVTIKKSMCDVVQQLLDNKLIDRKVVPKLLGNVLNLKETEFITEEPEQEHLVAGTYMQQNVTDLDLQDENTRKERLNHSPKAYNNEKVKLGLNKNKS